MCLCVVCQCVCARSGDKFVPFDAFYFRVANAGKFKSTAYYLCRRHHQRQQFVCERIISVWKVTVALVLPASVLNDFNEFQCRGAHCSQPKCKPFAIIQNNDNGLAFQVLDAYTLITTANAAEAQQLQNLFTASQTQLHTNLAARFFLFLSGYRSFRILIRAIYHFKYEYPERTCAHCASNHKKENKMLPQKKNE